MKIPLQVHHHTVLDVYARGHNPSTSASPYCTLRLCPGSESFYKYIAILYFTSLPGVTILLQVHHHSVLYVSARGHNPSTTTSPYSTSLPGVTILLQVHHHTVLYVSARGHNLSTSTSPYCTLRLCPGSQTFYNYITILYFTSLSWAQSFYKYITILYYTSLSGVAIILQVHHHTVLYVSARGHNPSKSTSPYCTLHLYPGSQSFYKYIPFFSKRVCPGSQSLYKYITILYSTSLSGVTILPQVHHHTVLNVSARGHNSATSTSSHCSIPLCPGSQSIYKYITILFYTSLPWVTILPQVHHHTVPNVSARGHNSSTSTSPYCTIPLCLGSQSFYKYITILYVSSRGHSPSKMYITILYLCLCPEPQSFYKDITILYFTSLPWVIIPLKVLHHAVLCVSARGHNPSTSTSPYCALRLYLGSQSL